MADTDGDTHGDSVSPSCIPIAFSENNRQVKYLANPVLRVYNPVSPSGAPPSGSIPHHSTSVSKSSSPFEMS
jgi:hypothetical protein